MKMKTLSMLVGVGAPLIATGAASADFLGINVVSKTNEFGLLVCNVYAQFSNPGDLMIAVAGTPEFPMVVQVLGGGTFYNHLFGGNTAPSTALINAFPSIAFDSFVTIGAKVTSSAFPDATVEAPGLPQIEGTLFATTESAWAVIPDAPQADPFNSDYGGPGDGNILIAQFATADGTGISGTMLLRFFVTGTSVQNYASFFHIVPVPGAVGLLGMAALFGARRRRRR